MGSRVYLDHVAGSPLRPAARRAMEATWDAGLGNPGSSHREGQRARARLDRARTDVAQVLDVPPRSVIFTGGGSEAVRIGLMGAAQAATPDRRHCVRSALDHPAVTDPLAWLAERDFPTEVVAAQPGGAVSAGEFLGRCGESTAVAGLLAVSHDLGTLQPIAEIGEALRDHGVPWVCDAALAPGRLALAPLLHAAPLVALSGPKFGGPQGTGVLIVAPGTALRSPARAGVQEEQLRGGLPNIAGAAGLAAALTEAVSEQADRATRYAAWESQLRTELNEGTGWRVVAGDRPRAPGVLCLSFDEAEGEAVMMNLDLCDVAVGTGSSCALGGNDVSPGLLAIGMDRRHAACTVRISFGWNTSADEVKRSIVHIRATLSNGRS